MNSAGAGTAKPKTFGRNDIWLILAVTAAVLIGFLILAATGGAAGTEVVVTVNDSEYARLPLDRDAELTLDDGHGGTNLLVIRGGEAYVAEANCHNQVCVDTGRISGEGELIVCLPHKVVISIEGSNE